MAQIALVQGKKPGNPMTREELLNWPDDLPIEQALAGLHQMANQVLSLVTVYKSVSQMAKAADQAVELSKQVAALDNANVAKKGELADLEAKIKATTLSMEKDQDARQRKYSEILGKLKQDIKGLEDRKTNLENEIESRIQTRIKEVEGKIAEDQQVAAAKLAETVKQAEITEGRLIKAEKALAALKEKL